MVVALTGCHALAQEPPADINKPFKDPDVKQFVERFETESREVYVQREAIARTLGLKAGDAVADIGAGTGLFTRIFAGQVGPKGTVYAVDIAPAFLKHIAEESKKRGQSQVKTIRGDQESTNLPPDSIDVAFLSDVYHHLEKHEKVLGSIRRALRPGGRLILVEFDRRKGVSSDFVMKHIRAGKETFLKEIEAAGFEPIELKDPPKFKENFIAAFRKKADPEPREDRP
jgi:ubiquinone/menaquinone biosynthesis C-methylase UbiE